MKAKIRNAMVTWNKPAYPGVGRLGSHAESGLHGRPARARRNGTLHWQFAIQWSHSLPFAAIKKDLPLAHFEEVRSWGGSRPVLPEGGL